MPITVREPQQLRSMEKKQRILDAALRCFTTLGFFHTTTVHIAKEAGISTGLIYGYFLDKEDILANVLEMYATRFLSPMRHLVATIDKTAPLEDKVATLHSAMLGIMEQEKESYREMKICALSHPNVQAYFMNVRKQLIGMMEEVLCPESPSRRYKSAVVAGFWAMESLCVAEANQIVNKTQARILLDNILGGLKNNQ